MKLLLAIALALSVLVTHGRAADLSPEEAKDHVGEAATVKGMVVQVIKGPKAIFLNFGGTYPNQAFTALSFKLPLSALSPFEGKTVSVTGTIKDNNGKPEMIIAELSQIKP